MARSAPLTLTTMPMTSSSSVVSDGRSARASTCSESAICGMAFAETKETASRWRKPAVTRARRYSALTSLGMVTGRPCQASRGHSMILTELLAELLMDARGGQTRVSNGGLAVPGDCAFGADWPSEAHAPAARSAGFAPFGRFTFGVVGDAEIG